MAALPVPDVVKQMADNIQAIDRRLENMERKMDRLGEEMASLKSTSNQVKANAVKIDELTGALSVAKDQLTWLCSGRDLAS